MDPVRAVEFGSIQCDRHAPVEATHGIQAAALARFGRGIGEHGREQGRQNENCRTSAVSLPTIIGIPYRTADATSRNSRAGNPLPVTFRIGSLSSLPSQTPISTPLTAPTNHASR